ncbi:MAG TPA: DUF692 domain-containing protein [Polyangiaceae bacterium]|nr:DUF692 domain-containing protein [Polyangiaceae bacterium]
MTLRSLLVSGAESAPVAPAPLRAGIGLRAVHHADVLASGPRVGWFEAHSENYFASGGALPRVLGRIREHYPLSMHGVGLSIGSTDPLDRGHLAELARLIRSVEPMLVSEHLSWSSVGGRFTNDLLPLPYTEEALRHMIGRVRQVQDFLGRRILIENVSSYLQFTCSTISEWEFIATLARESGCGLLLDINNLYVSATNHGFDAHTYLNGIPRGAVQEMHLAGHSSRRIGDREVLIDTHDGPVCDAVWKLYVAAVRRFGRIPTLIEWDSNIPALDVLAAEAHKADQIIEAAHARAA